MAKYLRMQQDQYGVNGLIPLTQGDDWSLIARAVDLIGGVEVDTGLPGITGASAFFPAATGGFIQGTIEITDTTLGGLTIGLPASGSALTLASNQGVQPYVTLTSSAGLETLYPYDFPLQILPRGQAPLY